MVGIPDYFCGYLEFEGDLFAYSAKNHLVTLLPAQGQDKDIIKSIKKLYNHKTEKPCFLRGVNQSNHGIAFFMQENFDIQIGQWRSASFGAPVIVKGSGNMAGFQKSLTADWDSFHVISFLGGTINTVYNPKIAALKLKGFKEQAKDYADFDGARAIKIRPFKEYTKSIPIICDDDQEVKLTVSVVQLDNEEDLKTVSLGTLKSLLRLEFKNAQKFVDIIKYYRLVRKLLALLVGQNNVSFEIALHQRTKEEKFIKTADCRINDRYEDVCTKQFNDVIALNPLLPYLKRLIEIINMKENNADHILTLLPNNNKNLGAITLTNVQDLCTALEIEYRAGGYKHTKCALIEDLKREIKETLKSFQAENPELDVNKQTTISSVYKNLDFTSKDRIFFLYNEHKDIIDELIEYRSLPGMSLERVGNFVKLRNSGTHTGVVDWGDNPKTYIPLLALAYLCLFKRAGIPSEVRENAIRQLFGFNYEIG